MSLACSGVLGAKTGFQLLSGPELDAAVPKDFYLEGNAIPVERRNALLLRTGSGKRVLVALLDTSGYSSQVQTKYAGLLITETPVNVCGTTLSVGSYGFGLHTPGRGTGGKAEVSAYDQSGDRLAVCSVEEDRDLDRPVPLQAVVEAKSGARIYLGRYWFYIVLISHVRVAR